MIKRMIHQVVLLLILLLLIPSPAEATILCSCPDCPQVSEDLLQLTEFSVTGNSPLKVGDSVTVKFKLKNHGQSSITFGPQGVFAVAKDPDSNSTSFGATSQNQTISVSQEINLETTKSLDRAGEWKIWPSYQIKKGFGLKISLKTGPDEWNVCALNVEALPSSPTPSPTPSPPTLPTLAPAPLLTPAPALTLTPELPDRFSFITDGPVMQEALEDGDKDGVLNYLDECPDTPPRLKDEVFENGCVCQDTDGGINYNEQGTITYRDRHGEEHTDQDNCSDNNIIEYYCRPDYEEGGFSDTNLRNFRHSHYCGEDYYCHDGRCLLRPGVGVAPAICFAPEGSAMEGTCADGIQNLNEEGVDCGGICPPCNTRCSTTTKYAPADTPCTAHYPTDPHRADWQWTDSESELVCQLTEVCHPDLDYIIEEATQCCSLMEETDIDGMPDSNLCREARNSSRVDCDVLYPWSTCYGLCQKCVSLYIIKGLGRYSRWMQGYNNLYTSGGACENGSCFYSGTEIAPSEMLVNNFKTGICRDYAQVTTTLLRKAGLAQSSIANACDGVHCYNVVRFPGDSQWHVVDTTGNNADINLGGLPTDYPYCFTLDESNWCFNGTTSTGETCEEGFIGEHEGYEYDLDAECLNSCQPGVACAKDLSSVPGWAPTIDNIIGCH